MARDRPFHAFAERGRVEDGRGDRALILDRKADQLGFGDHLVRFLPRGGDDELADAAALQLGRAADDGERVRGDPGFEPGGAGGGGG